MRAAALIAAFTTLTLAYFPFWLVYKPLEAINWLFKLAFDRIASAADDDTDDGIGGCF